VIPAASCDVEEARWEHEKRNPGVRGGGDLRAGPSGGENPSSPSSEMEEGSSSRERKGRELKDYKVLAPFPIQQRDGKGRWKKKKK